MIEFNSVFIGGLVGVTPNLAGWIVVIILAAIILRRGGRAERFIIVGASLKLFSNLLNIPAAAIVPWLIHGGATITYATLADSVYQILRGVVSMAGIIFLIYAFWLKFRAGRQELT